MKKNRVFIKKFIIILIVTLIPLVAATLIGLYSYNRYQDDYFYEYMQKIDENAKDRIQGYIKFTTISFEEEPFYFEDVKKGSERVLTIAAYRAIINANTNEDSEEIEEKLVYYFVVYNINYTKLIEIDDPTGEKKLLYNNIPGIYLKITDKNNAENTITQMLGAISTRAYIKDYESSPEKDVKGNELNSRYVRWLAYEQDEEYSNDLAFELIVSEDPSEDLSPGIITTFDLEVESEVDDIDTTDFTEGYNNSIFKAGYFNHVFKKRLWWHCLIAFAVVGVISFSFYAVWTAEENMKKVKK